jgi:hypothetical protein
MERQQVGAPEGTVQMGSSPASKPQAAASQPSPIRAPGFAAFGTSGGAAFVVRDLASI